ncbi:ankyrin repeat-containing domain protein [Aspergillus insuetus]
MAQFDNLPPELLQSIIRDILDELWGGVLTKQFLALRRVCQRLNRCITQEILRFSPGPWDWGLRYGIIRLQFLYQVLNRDSADGRNRMVLAINKAVDFAIEAKCNCNRNMNTAPAEEVVVQSTPMQYTRAITGLLLHDVDHLNYADFLAGTIQNRTNRSRYTVTLSDNEAHALAVVAASQEGDLAMLALLLSHARVFDPPPGLVGVGAEGAGAVLPNPLALAIRGQHADAVEFLLARWDSHGDVDCPDAPGAADGEYPIHVAARTGSIALVELFVSRRGGGNVNATTRTRASGGMTPLDIAASAGHVDLVKYLFGLPQTGKTGGAGVGVHGGGSSKHTIYYAVEAQAMETIEFLLAQPETIITTANWSDSPLSKAASLGRLDIIELLDTKGKAPSETELAVIYHGCLVTSIWKGDMAVFNYFFDKPGVPLGRWVDDDTSLLTAAVSKKQDEMFEKLVLRKEFDSGARRSALMQAVWLGKLDIAQRLIDVGDLELESEEAHRVRAGAIQYVRGRRDVFEFLQRAGILGADVQMPDW